jgi:hypothetical protein
LDQLAERYRKARRPRLTLKRAAQADAGDVVDDLDAEVVGRKQLLPELSLLLSPVADRRLCTVQSQEVSRTKAL